MHHPTPHNPDVSASEPSENSSVTPPRDRILLSSRARGGLVLLAGLTLVWISTLSRPTFSRDSEPYRFDGLELSGDYRHPIDALHIAALDRESSAFMPGRNIFTFASQPTTSSSQAPKEWNRTIHKHPKKQPEAIPDPAPNATFLGIFGPEHLRLAVLKDRVGGGVSNYREHDVIDDRYRVLSVDTGSVLLRDLASPDASPIRLKAP